MTYASRLWCPTCGTAIPAHTVETARVECRHCRRMVDVIDT